MNSLEEELNDLVLLISKKSLLFPTKGLKEQLNSIMYDYYSGEIPEEVLQKYEYLKERIIEEKKRLMRELYEVMWGNVTFLTETKQREMRQVKGGVVETTITRKQSPLPTQITLHLAEQALKIHSSTIEIDVLLEGSTVLEKKLIDEHRKEEILQ